MFARDGKLFSAEYGESGRLELEELAHFNAATPERLEAPEWARTWWGEANLRR